MATGKREDPFPGFNFTISLMDSTSSMALSATTISLSSAVQPVAGFSECTGLEMSLETEDYNEGGNNGTVLKFPKRVSYGEITLKKGLVRNTELWDWFYGFVLGTGVRKDGLIVLQDARHQPAVVWGFQRGLPSRYSGPQLNARQNEAAVESVQIVHEGLYQIPGAGGIAQAASEAVGAIADLF